MSRLLLLSNSRNPGGEYLAHALPAIGEVLSGRDEVLFIPWAAVSFTTSEYSAKVATALAPLGVRLRDLAAAGDPVQAVRQAQAILVGGGNSFALLDRMCRRELLRPVRERIGEGAPYIGWSAGANLACPTIRTTNDMPIVEPPSLAALGLVPFQINPHYTERTIPDHGGESRDERIAEFLVLNPAAPVVGLREGSTLRLAGGRAELLGPHPLRLFRAGAQPRDLPPGPVPQILAG